MNDRIQRITVTRAKAIRTVSAVSGFNFSDISSEKNYFINDFY